MLENVNKFKSCFFKIDKPLTDSSRNKNTQVSKSHTSTILG